MKIGEFARLGQVSVRMLRHYDGLGLLVPDHVDPWTGHRGYGADQLGTLHRLIALKELGFTLEQVRRVLAQEVSAGELRDLLEGRRTELAEELDRTRWRLAEVTHRLRMIESEDVMSEHEFILKIVEAMPIVARSFVVPAQPQMAEAVGPLFEVASERLTAAGGCAETGVGVYDSTEDGLSVIAGYLHHGAAVDGLEAHVLPAGPVAAAVHLGEMSTAGRTLQGLLAWCEQQGHQPDGPYRYIHLEADGTDQSDWVTEVQQPVRPRPRG